MILQKNRPKLGFAYIYEKWKNSGDFVEGVSRPEFIKICSEYNKLLTEIINTGKEVTLPKKCGMLGLRRERNNPYNGAINWLETKKQGKIVRHDNADTNGFYFRICWTKRPDKYTTKAFKYYKMSYSKRWKRRLGQKVKETKGILEYV